ncbi:MAG: PEGA domain-containing protein [Prevotellaceae bacterium]|jgi:hypothetical protein|nr:PEGA domain-containing protein [Prevotellaceae bacterium]
MKRILPLVVACCLAAGLPAAAQELSVVEFYANGADQSARITDRRTDRNNKTCAIVKIETPLAWSDFTFEAGMAGIEHSEPRTGEIWLYLSPGTRRLTLKHAHLGVLRDYEFSEPLREATVYIMKLRSGTVRTVVEETPAFQYLVIHCALKGATVKIDDAAPEMFLSGKFSKPLPYGKHAYTVEAPLHHPVSGLVEITAGKPEPIHATLRPAFGKLTIHTQPEQGAEVLIDGEWRGVTPLTVDTLRSGKHTVRAFKNLFIPVTEDCVVHDGQATTAQLTLPSNFATLAFRADGDIYINNERKAAGTWNDRLTPGLYNVEVRKPSHRSSFATIEARNGEQRTINLDPPKPMYGMLDVTVAAHIEAAVLVDGKRQPGATPMVVNEILAGEHEITLTADGYEPYTEKIQIAEGRMATLQATLREKPKTATLTVDANAAGATVNINGAYAGTTPLTQTDLKPGKATVAFSHYRYKPLTQTVTLRPGANELYGQLKEKWTMPPVKGRAFAEYLYAPASPFGVSIGYCKRWGAYLRYKADRLFSLIANDESDSRTLYTANDYPDVTDSDLNKDSREVRREAFTAGVMFYLAGGFYLHAGAGYGVYGEAFRLKTPDVAYAERPLDSELYDFDSYFCPDLQQGLELEGGLSYSFSYLYFSVGYHLLTLTGSDSVFGSFHAGFGVAF